MTAIEANAHKDQSSLGTRRIRTRHYILLAVVALLIAVIGGRVTPSFTRNWQTKRGGPLPAVAGRLDAVTLALTAAGLVAWSVAPTHPAAGALLLAAGGLNLVRLIRWRGDATVADAMLDRIMQNHHRLTLTGESLRKARPSQKREENQG